MSKLLPKAFSLTTSTTKRRRASLIVSVILVLVASVRPAPGLDGASRKFHSETATTAKAESHEVSSLIHVAGSGQVTPINNPFTIQFRILVAEDGIPQPGVTVTFTAPSEGASGTFAGGDSTVEVATGDDGIATAPVFTANGTAGTYQVIAETLDGSLAFDLTNAKAGQTIDFPPLAAMTFGDPPFEVSATASSNLPVSFSITSGPATISANTITLNGAGTVTVTASQSGDDNNEPAPAVEQSFTIGKADQTITFPLLPNRINGTADFEVTASASSGLTVVYAATGHCTISGSIAHLTGAGSCTLTASQDGDDTFNPAPNVRQSFFISEPGERIFDLRAFGAVGDGVANDSPAFQAALDAIADAGAGTLIIPEGRYALLSSVSKDFAGQATSLSIRGIESDIIVDFSVPSHELADGLNLLSEVFPRTGNMNALSISGLEQFYVSDVAFVGTPDVETDAAITLLVTDVNDATIKHSEFYGLRTVVPGAGIVVAQRSGLTIQDTKFLGSFGHSATYTPNVQNIEWKAINISNVLFIDYGRRPELYCKCQNATYSWINVGNAAAVTAQSPRREASIRNIFLDEGAYNGLTSLPSLHQPASAPIDLLYLSGLRMNVSNFGTSGNYLWDVQRLLITDAYYGWSHNADAAITLVRAGNAIIQKAECVAAADRIQADAGTVSLTLINSTYAELNSQAQVTRELVTDNPDDDPVEYVRNRFGEIVERAPEPAAHFYWSNLILECGDDSQCISNQKAALDAYLDGAPAKSIKVTGQIKDEMGAAVPNVTISLSGSQVVTTHTDQNGRYSFAGLPSSGVYTVTATLAQYIFNPANKTMTTPTTDQTVDFTAVFVLQHHTINGRVINAMNAGVANVTVTLSGSQTGTVMTDTAGWFSFPGLARGGDYLLTPSRSGYIFGPASYTVTNLSADQELQISGNPPLPQLMVDPTEPAADVLAAVDSVLLTDGPFEVHNTADWLELGLDPNARLMLFAANVTLEPGDMPASVVLNLVDANSQTYAVPAEDVRLVPNSAFKQIVFRIPDSLAAGTCRAKIIFRGQASNIGTLRIVP